MKILKISFLSTIFFTILLGIIYPFLVWGIGQLLFSNKANGTLFYYKDGKVIGSEWIAQNFTSGKYFHPRPSAAGDKGYDASNSSGSNFGPTSQKLVDALRQRASAYRSENNLSSNVSIPVEAITTSGSGLDPHISVKNALIQSARVASARGLSQETVNNLIKKYTEGKVLGFLGEERVNVLRINLALDGL